MKHYSLFRGKRTWLRFAVACTLFPLLIPGFLFARGHHRGTQSKKEPIYPVSSYHTLKWRNVGPFRGGRSTAASGVVSEPLTYYLGTAGGGLWKTTDAGVHWKNVTDGYIRSSSIGAVAVSESDPNVIYIGTGEAPARTVNPTHGTGVYKSTDAGKTWKSVGLKNTAHINRIVINPKNPDIVYVAAEGTPWKKTADRGIYRSEDGGKTWKKVLFVDDESGANDLSMDMTNPRILYAAFWDHQRLPWKIISGGQGSGIYKSTDGGDSWTKLDKGLPKEMGKIGVSVSRANPERVYAIVEAKNKGGLYRSDDAGKSWKLINSKRVIQARSWYYMDVFADPKDQNKVYVMNAPFLKSIDGGKTFKVVKTPHTDNHFLWVNPENTNDMINCNDGGGNVSLNGGKSWSTHYNQPTGEFYRVITDNRFPYYIYGGQQDDGTVAIANWSGNAGIDRTDWYAVGGGESSFIAFNPDKPDLVYAGSYQGIITEYNSETKKTKFLSEYAALRLGANPAHEKYRFTWNAPIITSHFDPSVIYHAGNKILKSTDRGITWSVISPDLTRNLSERNIPGGGPITNEGAGGEIYQTISYLAESPASASTLWAGTDDGLIHITRDGGQHWENITPKGIGNYLVNCIDISKQDPATAYISVMGYKSDDLAPYVYMTNDYGKHWKEIIQGLPKDAMVHAVREDPFKKGLLYAATQRGMFVSFDNGEQWQSLQLNLPMVPVTDLTIHNHSLVISTLGRAFWVLDDISPLRQLDRAIVDSDVHLFKVTNPYLTNYGKVDTSAEMGTNPHTGAGIYYYLKKVTPADSTKNVTVEILDKNGSMIRKYSSTAKKKPNKTTKKSGLNILNWNLRYPAYKSVKGLFHAMSINGYEIGPGEYTAKLTYDGHTETHSFNVLPDPRINATAAAYSEQQDMLKTIHDHLDSLYAGVNRLNDVEKQIKGFIKKTNKDSSLAVVTKSGKAIVTRIIALKNQLIQTKQKTFQDVINFPNMLDNQLLFLQNVIDGQTPPVTNGQKERFADLNQQWAKQKMALDRILNEDVPGFNKLLSEKNVPFVSPGNTDH